MTEGNGELENYNQTYPISNYFSKPWATVLQETEPCYLECGLDSVNCVVFSGEKKDKCDIIIIHCKKEEFQLYLKQILTKVEI